MTDGSTPNPKAEWWTTSDVAAYLGVGIGTVSTYRNRRQMPEPDRTVGRTHVWRPTRIVRWNASRPGRGGLRRQEVRVQTPTGQRSFRTLSSAIEWAEANDRTYISFEIGGEQVVLQGKASPPEDKLEWLVVPGSPA